MKKLLKLQVNSTHSCVYRDLDHQKNNADKGDDTFEQWGL